jgi:hypothetical protein
MAGLGCGSWLGEKELLKESSDTRDITYREEIKGPSQRELRLQRPPPFHILSSWFYSYVVA